MDADKINEMFSKIAFKYDFLNDVMSFGLHRLWKHEAIKMTLKECKPLNALDLCTGTGDLAIYLSKLSPNTNIIAADNCKNMLEILKKKNVSNKITIKSLDCGSPSHGEFNFKFDLITVGYGLRNITNRKKCISDIYNMLTPNGVFMCIDLGHFEPGLLPKIFSFYFNNVIPYLGSIFANSKSAYDYFTQSLATWYKQEELKTILLEQGFKKCYYKNFLFGIVAIHIACK